MNTIDQNASNALMQARPNNGNWAESNTTVSSAHNDAYMYLHGHIIAIRNFETGIIKITNAGYFSKVTKSRLNALPNVEIKAKKGIWFLNGKEWDGQLTEI